MTNNDARADFTLSAEQREQFERDGYIGPVQIYEPEVIEERWRTVRRQLVDRSHAIYDANARGSATNIANYDRHLDIDLLSEHIMDPRIVDRVASIIGPDVLCWRTEFFPKYAGDEGTDWHQAATFANASKKPQIAWPSENGEPAFGGTITVWTAFTDSTLENGCLQLMPGTHRHMNYDESKPMDFRPETLNNTEKEGIKRGFFGYDYRQLQTDPDWKPDESQAFPLVMRAGEAVIFWSTLMHASLPHTGSVRDYRMGFAARYVPTKVKVYPETDDVVEYGGAIDLSKYGAVLVSGVDDYGINRIATENQRGYPFRVQ
ncbi:chlorinating enzyme [Streptomyces sp. NBC_01808]|uniref:chlorinating enzyme n=1 Tax=Streptomyces sp. NBC_01808 TaxID=2975947 RepID=UPI002DDAF4E0|nr:chlorinating enzyme [Streptomyces sp. NBC_01808]WSA38350.1 chlorinating enzyme [Streptomyces sp. NBC_01808]